MLAANRLRQSLEPDRRSPRATAAGEQKWPRVRQSSRLPRHSQVLEPELCAHAVAECVATSRKETSRCRPAHTRNHSEAESSAVPENPQWPQHRRLPSHSATAVAWRTFPTSVAGRGPILRTHKFLNRPGWLRNLLLATARMPVRRLSVKFRVAQPSPASRGAGHRLGSCPTECPAAARDTPAGRGVRLFLKVVSQMA